MESSPVGWGATDLSVGGTRALAYFCSLPGEPFRVFCKSTAAGHRSALAVRCYHLRTRCRVRITWMVLVCGCPYISASQQAARMDLDEDGIARPEDCDDGDPRIGGAAPFWVDDDGDGFGQGDPTTACSQPQGYAARA